MSDSSSSSSQVVSSGCADDASWSAFGGGTYTCAWWAMNDPGCTYYSEYGQTTACVVTCNTCTTASPPTSAPTIATGDFALDDIKVGDCLSVGCVYSNDCFCDRATGQCSQTPSTDGTSCGVETMANFCTTLKTQTFTEASLRQTRDHLCSCFPLQLR